MRQLAWLHTAPKPAGGDNLTSIRKSRAEQFDESEKFIDMPACDLPYMIDYLFQIGPVINSGAIPHSEIESWQKNTGYKLNGWEAATLRRLSISYLNESSLAEDINRPAPFDPDAAENIMKEKAAKAFAASMAGRFGRK